MTGIAERRAEPLDRRGEPAVGEHRRRDPAREVAQLGDRRAGLLARLADQLGQLGLVVEPRLGPAEVHAQRDEPRLRAVVQVALDPPQLGGLDVDRAAPRAGEHVDALLELLLAARPLPDDDRVHGERGDEHRQRPHRPEVTAAGQRPDREVDRGDQRGRLRLDAQRPVRAGRRRQRHAGSPGARRRRWPAANQTQAGQK